jgi:hypothetical protein
MEYREFVKMMFQKHKGMPAKDIMKIASVEWKKTKASGASPKGKKTKGGVMSPLSTISDGGGIGMTLMRPSMAIANFQRGRGIGQSVHGSSGGYSGGMYTAGGMTAGKMKKSKKEQAGNIFDDVLGGVGKVLGVGAQMLPFLPHLI